MTGFIFDLDGTLMDTISCWIESEQSVLDTAGVTLTVEQRDTVNTMTLDEVGEYFHGEFGVMDSSEQVKQAIVDRMLAFYRTEAKVKPGALAAVKAVSEAGAPMCVLSSSPFAFIDAGLTHGGLRQYFDDEHIISAEDNGMTKREPRTFELVCNLLGTPPEQTWLFDDSWYALETARDFGVRTVGVFSSDDCATHETLHRYSERVFDDFTAFDLSDYR